MGKLSTLTQEEFEVLQLIIQNKATQLCTLFPRFRAMGFERVTEIIEGWLESGDAELVEDDVLDCVDIQYNGVYAEVNFDE